MLATKLFFPTLKEDPAEATLISHKLMIRSGMIRQVASGIYNWLPLGLRVFQKTENIVRQEMNNIGGMEVMMPCVQPIELWEESGRWNDYGPELLRFTDRHNREFCMGPTHEEVVTDIVRKEISSHKELPLTLYQIHTKFRDEIRPRFGVMRGREFTMKDAYSFNLDEASLHESYSDMRNAYINIFNRVGVEFKIVDADSGSIGGSSSEEFNVLADSGENALALSEDGSYAANVELVPTFKLENPPPSPTMEMELIDTPGIYTVAGLEDKIGLPAFQGTKIMLVHAADWTKEKPSLIGLLLRGDRSLNYVKAEGLDEVKVPLTMASREEVTDIVGCPPGSIGPVNLKIPVIGDYEIAGLSDFVCGSNQNDKHYKGVNWGRDCPLPKLADLRNITSGEPSPSGGGNLTVRRGIEVGHIFKLGDKYSQSMNSFVTDDKGEKFPILMGCYGIGIDRVMAACIEQNHDDKGIIWPREVAPFAVTIIPLPLNDSEVMTKAKQLYDSLTAEGIEVLFDDRDLRAGNKFNNCDLLGIPLRIVVSSKSLQQKGLELKERAKDDPEIIPLDNAMNIIKDKLASY
ncbi:MAG: proline--tRNA ligase [Candidatus Portiera sp.]|nr:proline--tRNA ligase [Portiera sp.]